MHGKARLVQPGMKLTSINHSRIDHLSNATIMDLHERLHELFQLGVSLEDEEVCRRAMTAHKFYVYQMLQRGLSHPYLDMMDDHTQFTESHDEQPADAETDPHEDGIMIAFMLPEKLASQIAVEGGEPIDDLHITLAYLGHTTDWDQPRLQELPGVVSVYAANSKPLVGHISGSGRFAASPSSDQRDVLYRSVDIKDLPAWRQGLIDWLDGAGFTQQSEHGYIPHITIRYLDPSESIDMGTQELLPVEFTELVCKIGPKVYTFPLASLHFMQQNTWVEKLLASQEKLHESRTSVFSQQVRRHPDHVDPDAGVSDLPGRGGVSVSPDEAAEVDAVDLAGLVAPGGAGDTIVYGVLLVPDEPDLEGDRFPAEVVRRTCERYSTNLPIEEEHKRFNPNLDVVDSFISPAGYAIEGHPVKPGSWVVGIRTQDQEVIDKITRGDYQGLSIEGSATVRPRKML